MRSIRDFINIISEAGTYTGLDPIIRKRSGMGPATNAEIEAFLKANPNYGWVLDRNGNRTNMMSGGEQEMLKSARAEAAKLPAAPAQAAPVAEPAQAAPVAEPAQAATATAYNAAADSQAANAAMPNNGLPATYNAAADSQAANAAMPNNGLPATGSAALDGSVAGADPATTIAAGPDQAAGAPVRSDSAAQPVTNRDSMTFSQAFADARKNNEKTFTWKGKSYAVKLADTSKPATTPATTTTTPATTTTTPATAKPVGKPVGKPVKFGSVKDRLGNQVYKDEKGNQWTMPPNTTQWVPANMPSTTTQSTPTTPATTPATNTTTVSPRPTGLSATYAALKDWDAKYGGKYDPKTGAKLGTATQSNKQLDPRGKPLVKDKDGNLGYYNNPNVPSKGFTVVVPVAPAGGMYKESAGYSEDQILARIIDLARR